MTGRITSGLRFIPVVVFATGQPSEGLMQKQAPDPCLIYPRIEVDDALAVAEQIDV
jgi:hypothetical protein